MRLSSLVMSVISRQPVQWLKTRLRFCSEQQGRGDRSAVTAVLCSFLREGGLRMYLN